MSVLKIIILKVFMFYLLILHAFIISEVDNIRKRWLSFVSESDCLFEQLVSKFSKLFNKDFSIIDDEGGYIAVAYLCSNLTQEVTIFKDIPNSAITGIIK
ncbi:hypothetical protein AUN14_20600 [Cronobacter muytjensii]|uniref:Uncharacterized protein n=1 Tax=Cronobacter muytjensii TaxID=413501 RepID=A0A2T7AI99_9ENTR|nr:hypothetical protein AUN14_20600 [Cronobacter muytjensii]